METIEIEWGEIEKKWQGDKEANWESDPSPNKKQSHKARSQWTHCVTICISLSPLSLSLSLSLYSLSLSLSLSLSPPSPMQTHASRVYFWLFTYHKAILNCKHLHIIVTLVNSECLRAWSRGRGDTKEPMIVKFNEFLFLCFNQIVTRSPVWTNLCPALLWMTYWGGCEGVSPCALQYRAIV